MGVNRTVSKVAGEGGLLNEANLKNLSDSDVQKVGDAITNAYAETVKADPNMKVTEAQIEAYKQQSKKSMGSRANAIAQILIKTDELKSTLSNKIDEAKVKVKEAGIDIDETTNNKALQGDGDGGRIQESGQLSTAPESSVTPSVRENADLLSTQLLDELAQSGVKYNPSDVSMISKTPEGKLLWLEKGNESSGLIHIVTRHGADFSAKGISDVPSFLYKVLQTDPVIQGAGAKGSFAEFQIGENRYRMAYGSNGYIVSIFPLKSRKKFS